MFGLYRIAKARKACVTALQPFVARPAVLGSWPRQFWRDPFVLGFFVGTIALMSRLATKGKLNSEQAGHVMIDTLKDLGGYAADFNDRIEALIREQNPDYLLGMRNSETVITYVMDLQPMPDDPDVAAATELARETSLTGKVDRAEIGGSLMHLLFHRIVQKRLGA